MESTNTIEEDEELRSIGVVEKRPKKLTKDIQVHMNNETFCHINKTQTKDRFIKEIITPIDETYLIYHRAEEECESISTYEYRGYPIVVGFGVPNNMVIFEKTKFLFFFTKKPKYTASFHLNRKKHKKTKKPLANDRGSKSCQPSCTRRKK